MRKRWFLVSALLLVSLLMACAPQATPAPAPQAPAGAAAPAKPAPAPAAALPAAPAKPVWQGKWDETVQAAKQEGSVSFTTSGGASMRTALVQGFKDAFGIRMEAVSGEGAQFVPKFLQEYRAGVHLHDVYMGGASTVLINWKPAGLLTPIPPALILPDLTEPELVKKTWYMGEPRWLDKDRIMLSLALYPQYPVAINTNLVKEEDIKSWRDLLNPKWQGKLLLSDPTTSGVQQTFLSFVEAVLGWDFFVELAQVKPIILRDQRLMTDWLAQGKVAIVMFPKTDTLTEFVKAGAPVKGLTPKEGTFLHSGSANVVMLDKAPHPNAAKVLVNWLMSKEGSTALSKASGYHMTRLDVPTDHLSPDQLRDPKLKYYVLDEEATLNLANLGKKAGVLLAPLMQK